MRNKIFYPEEGMLLPDSRFVAYGVARVHRVRCFLLSPFRPPIEGVVLGQPEESLRVPAEPRPDEHLIGKGPYWKALFVVEEPDAWNQWCTLVLVTETGLELDRLEHIFIPGPQHDIGISSPTSTDRPCPCFTANGTANPGGQPSGTLTRTGETITGTNPTHSGTSWTLDFNGCTLGATYTMTINVQGNPSVQRSVTIKSTPCV
jgi:hypothetical protein